MIAARITNPTMIRNGVKLSQTSGPVFSPVLYEEFQLLVAPLASRKPSSLLSDLPR